MSTSRIFDILNDLQLPYQRFDHQAVFSAADAHDLELNIPGADTKNLVLNDSKQLYLLVVPLLKKVNLKKTAEILNVKKLSFANPKILMEKLGVEPGSVSMLGLFNDSENSIQLVIDQEIWEQELWSAHPLINTSTLVIAKNDYLKFFEYTGHVPRSVAIPAGE